MCEGTVWLPVEVTMVGGRFLDAWQAGARQWRESSERAEAELLPVKDSWAVYRRWGRSRNSPQRSASPTARPSPRRTGRARPVHRPGDRAARFGLDEGDRLPQDRSQAPQCAGRPVREAGRIEQAAAQFEAASKLAGTTCRRSSTSATSGSWPGTTRTRSPCTSGPGTEMRRTRPRCSAWCGPMQPWGTTADARTAFEALVKLSTDLAKQYSYLQESASDSARAASRRSCGPWYGRKEKRDEPIGAGMPDRRGVVPFILVSCPNPLMDAVRAKVTSDEAKSIGSFGFTMAANAKVYRDIAGTVDEAARAISLVVPKWIPLRRASWRASVPGRLGDCERGRANERGDA